MRRPWTSCALVAAGAAALLAWFGGRGFVNYDSLYGLVWGRELWEGRIPDFERLLAPTPHPLANALGFLLAPLSRSGGDLGAHGVASETVVEGLALLSLVALAVVVFELGRAWFNAAVGAIAAAIVMTREPVLSFGLRAYVDVPYLVLVLGALLAETRRPRNGTWTLGLLGLAGLLRPEAWLLAGAYVAYLAVVEQPRDRARLIRLAALAVAAPVAWALSDLLISGDPLHSLTGTRETADTLGRVTGLDDLLTAMPRRLGEVLREPVLVGAAGGGVMALAWLRERARLGAAAGLLAVGAFCVLAAAGLSILTRYLLLPAALLAIFCGVGAFGWTLLARDDPRRRPALALGVLTLALLVGFAPAQARRLDRLRDSLATQSRIVGDLRSLTEFDRATSSIPITTDCGPVALPNHRAVPNLALWLDVDPDRIVSAQVQRPAYGTYVDPSSERVARQFVLDPRDPRRLDADVPPQYTQIGGNRSWRVYARCPVGG